MFNFDGSVRRCDLNLRAEFPELKTRIFKLKSDFYMIYCNNVTQNFEELKEYFDQKVRFVGTPVKVTNDIPTEYDYELDPIKDKKIAENFEGMPFRTIDLLNLLSAEFPDIDFNKVIGNEGDNKIKIYIKPLSSNKDLEKLELYLEKMKPIVPFEIIQEETKTKELFENPATYIYSTNLFNNPAEYEKRDEALWFDNLEKIYEGEFKKSDLYFYNENNYTSFVDFSSFKNVNLRNQLFLYDETYLSIPIEKPIEYFCEEQKIKTDEIFELIEKNRINILLTQPISRYDTDFLDEVYSINSEAIVSRRAISSLVLSDLIEINNNYFINQMDLVNEIPTIAEIFSSIVETNPKYIYELLSWPIKAVRNSLNVFDFGSPMKIGTIGVNNAIDEYISNKYKKNLEFEFVTSSPNIHIANALNATYFPYRNEGFSDRFYTTMMGYMLNFFKNSSVNKLINYNNIKNNQVHNKDLIDPVLLFEIDEYIPAKKFNNICQFINTPDRAQSLISYLSSLPEKERKNKIEEYNKEVEKNLEKEDYLDLSYNAILDTAGIWVPFLSTGIKGIEIISNNLDIDISRINKIKEKMCNIFSSSNVDDDNINFLTKINRVARLKQEYK